jgi:pyridoxamine 5'-phosphate oxidase
MKDPFVLFAEWLLQAKTHPDIFEPTAMTLATATNSGVPSTRIVLLKSFDEQGFVFYTNMESRKSMELAANPHAALCFFWKAIAKQVRIEGVAERASDAEADKYFASRHLISRFGAIASKQSQPLLKREDFLTAVDELQQRYTEEKPPPRPDFWSGWRIVPSAIEFWEEGEYRLHDRTLFTREGKGWKVDKLYP